MKTNTAGPRLRYRLKYSTRILLYFLLAFLLISGIFIGLDVYHSGESAKRRSEAEISRYLGYAQTGIDAVLTQTERAYLTFLFNTDLYDQLIEYDLRTSTLRNRADIEDTMRALLVNLEDITSAQICNDDYVFSTNNITYASPANIGNSEHYRQAKTRLSPSWIPTYDFTVEYGHERLMDRSLPVSNRDLISYVGLYNGFRFKHSNLKLWPSGKQKPVVFFHLNVSVFENLLREYMPYENMRSCIYDDTGRCIVSTVPSDLYMDMDPMMADTLTTAEKDGSYAQYRMQDGMYILSSCRLENGWKIVTAIPRETVYAEAYDTIFKTLGEMIFILLPVVLLLALAISHSLSHPIRRLLQAIVSVEAGNYHTELPRTSDEFGVVYEAFNKMGERIETLIYENYESTLRERENELRALKYQTKPHFLYNALNIIRWSSLRHEDHDSAQMLMSLSNLMRYILRDNRNIVSLREEIGNVMDYFDLVRQGYNNMIKLQMDIDPTILNASVCKMTLQPLVENCVQHGLKADGEGIVSVRGFMDGSRVCLRISDNGKGWPEGFRISDKEHTTDSIGLANVRRRLALTYGAEGTLRICDSEEGGAAVEITLPYRFFEETNENT